MKYLLPPAILFILALAYGLGISQYHPPILPDELVPQNAPGYYDYRGVTHSHTSLNKGTLSPEEVIEEAQVARLDFLILTDLNYFLPYPIKPDYYQNLLVMVGKSYSYLDSHILHYSLEQLPQFNGLGEAQVYFSDRLSKTPKEETDDFVVLAHPFKGGRNWSGPYPKSLQGIETINLKSVWRIAWEKTKPSFFWSIFIYPFNSHLSLLRLFQHPKKEVELWDELNRDRPTIGFVGNETTGPSIPLEKPRARFPSYKTSFEIASNHVLLRSELTGNVVNDRKKVLSALRKGQFYMCLDYLENPKGFVTYIESGDRQIQMGSQVSLARDMRLVVKLPHEPTVPFEVMVIKDGRSIHRSNKKITSLPLTESGVYRIIVRVIPTLPLPDGKKWIPWIYTNPFFIQSPPVG